MKTMEYSLTRLIRKTARRRSPAVVDRLNGTTNLVKAPDLRRVPLLKISPRIIGSPLLFFQPHASYGTRLVSDLSLAVYHTLIG